MHIPDDLFSNIAASVDKLNRGGMAAGSIDIAQTTDLAHSAVDWVISITEQDVARTDSAKCDMVSEKGKRLYLQAQTLRASGQLLMDLRAVLLGLGSLLLVRFKTGLPPALRSQLARKLSSAAADLAAVGADLRWQVATSHCCIASISILRQLDTLLLAQCMPSREIEQVQVAMMTEYLRAARLLLTMEEPPSALLLLGTSKSDDKSTIAREYVNLAALSAQNIDPLATVSLCEALLTLAEELHCTVAANGHNLLEEAAYFLAFARERLDLCVSSTVAAQTTTQQQGQRAQTPPPSAASTRALRLNLAFSLAHASCQLGRNEEAFVLIEEAETELRAAEPTDEARTEADKWTLSFLVPYAKFHVRASQSSWTQARSCLLEVIHSHAEVKTVLGLVRRYVEGNACSAEGQREIFQLCAQAFPAAPAHVEVLMARLEALLGSSPAVGIDASQMKEALSLAQELVAQQDKGSSLSEIHSRTLRALLRSRVSYFLATAQWGLVEHWASLLLRMLGGDTEEIMSPALARAGSRIDSAPVPSGSKDVLLLRAYARSQMGRHADAREDCERAWTLEPGADTALAAFRSEMSCPVPASQAAMHVTATQRKSYIEGFLRHCDKLRADGSLSQSDELMLIARAARIARDTDTAASSGDSRRCQQAFADLLRYWMQRYERGSAWRLTPLEKAVTDENAELTDAEPSLMRIASELLHCCLEDFLKCFPPAPVLESSGNLPSLSPLTCSANSDKENQTPLSPPLKRARVDSAPEEAGNNSEEFVAKKGPRRRLLSRHAMDEAEKQSQEENAGAAQASPQQHPEGSPDEDSMDACEDKPSDDAASETDLTPLPVQSSPVSFFRLPQFADNDCTFLDRTTYTFETSLSSLQRDLVAPLQTTSRLLAAASFENLQGRLGSFSEALWLADLAWNIANLFVHKKQCSILDDNASDQAATPSQQQPQISAFQSTPHDSMRLLTAAHLFELAEGFYGTCLTYEDGQIHSLALGKNQHSCLLVGAACRLDAHSLGPGHTATESRGLRAAAASAQKALDMLSSQAGFQDACAQQLHRTSLLLLFTALCRSSEGAEDADIGAGADALQAADAPVSHTAVEFLEQYKEQLQNLSVSELLQLSAVAAAGPYCPASATYRLLTLAWERNKEPPLPGEPLMQDIAIAADIQCRLLLLAPSPAAALEHVLALCDLCTEEAEAEADVCTGQKTAVARVQSVRRDTMDQACSVAFNFGATLSETGQATLAEKFLAHAVAMLPYASPAFGCAWRARMERAYYALLQKLLPHRAHEGTAPHGLASFGLKTPTPALVRSAR